MFWWYKIGLHRKRLTLGAVEPLRYAVYEVARIILAAKEKRMSLIVILIILLLVFGFGGYRLGPGLGYYGGGGISLIILIVIILLLLRVI